MAKSAAALDEKDQRILSFIEERSGFAGTAEVAEELKMTTNGAEYRLKNLESEGEIDSRVVSRDKVWYLPTEPEMISDGGYIERILKVVGLSHVASFIAAGGFLGAWTLTKPAAVSWVFLFLFLLYGANGLGLLIYQILTEEGEANTSESKRHPAR